jgi:hypothetical protein
MSTHLSALRRLIEQLHDYGKVTVSVASIRDLIADRDRLDGLINNAHTDDFLEAVRLEAAHQVERWGEAHDRGKSAENWFWLVGYLAGKALRAAITSDKEKAKHHTISSAAALLNWHKAISCDATGSGIGDDRDLIELDRFKQSFAAPNAPESTQPPGAGSE